MWWCRPHVFRSFALILTFNMAPTTITGPSCQPSLRTVMDLVRAIGERLIIQENLKRHLIAEKWQRGRRSSRPLLCHVSSLACTEDVMTDKPPPHQDQRSPTPTLKPTTPGGARTAPRKAIRPLFRTLTYPVLAQGS